MAPSPAKKADVLLLASIYILKGWILTENHTPEFTLRIRLLAIPSAGEFDEFHLEHYHVGQPYVVPARLASLLILSGYAELVDNHARAKAADFGHPRFPKHR